MRLALCIALVTVVLLGGCASREELTAKGAAIPAGVDLSGQWQLRASDRPGRRSADGSLVHVFLEMGEALKITQTDFGLFISFDRAIVEEYRFGEKRRISVGEIEADRVSGWEDNAYIIETLDMDGVKLIETYRLVDARTLSRSIVVVDDDERHVDVTQSFDRS